MHREGISKQPFDQMLVNDYLPGQGISLHCDYKTFGGTVVSLSLLSACVMDFGQVSDKRREAILLEPRGLLILADEARNEWRHGIASRKNDRWQQTTIPRGRRLSITFRVYVQASK
jgi:alkylated DNA repair dioxygenase AlkB